MLPLSVSIDIKEKVLLGWGMWLAAQATSFLFLQLEVWGLPISAWDLWLFWCSQFDAVRRENVL